MHLALAAALLAAGAGPLAAQYGTDQNAENQNHHVAKIAADMPVDSPTITVTMMGRIQDVDGQPIPNAAVELEMNPYYRGDTSTSTWTATDAGGVFLLSGQGHQGTARLRVAAVGRRSDQREVGYIKRDRLFEYNFVLPEQRQP